MEDLIGTLGTILSKFLSRVVWVSWSLILINIKHIVVTNKALLPMFSLPSKNQNILYRMIFDCAFLQHSKNNFCLCTWFRGHTPSCSRTTRPTPTASSRHPRSSRPQPPRPRPRGCPRLPVTLPSAWRTEVTAAMVTFPPSWAKWSN